METELLQPSPGNLSRGDYWDRYIRFHADAIKDGCPRDQTENFIRAGIILQQKQRMFAAACRLCDVPDGPTEIGFGGARGGGKSHVGLAQMGADDCQRRPGLKCLLLRKVGKANIEHFSDLRLKLFSKIPHKFDQKGILTFANGSRIIAGHFQAESDIDAYLGLEYDIILIEEATTLSHGKYKDIGSCLRTSKQDWRPRIYSNANPGGTGHVWYRSRFIIPYESRTETDTRFIPSRVWDNAYNNPDYVKRLNEYTGWKLRAWRDGDWDIAAGQYFTTFRREHHVVSEDIDPRIVSSWHCGFDYGFTHYTYVPLGARDNDGNWHIVDEHAERGWIPKRHAEAIRAMVGRHKFSADRPLTLDDIPSLKAGPDVFGKKSDGKTIAQDYSVEGIRLGEAYTDRVNGWAEIQKLLGDVRNGHPARLFIHRRCARLIDCLPSLQHDPDKPEDVLKVDVDEDGAGGDDPADGLRYMVATQVHALRTARVSGI